MSDIDIFRDDEDRKLLIDAFLTAKEKHNYKLLGIVIYPSGYEMIIYDNGSDISKIMKSINISFSMKYKCQHEDCGHIFKERYKSEILEKTQVQKVLDQLPECKHLDQTWLDPVDLDACNHEACIDCLDEAKERLIVMVEEIGLSYEDMLKKKKIRNDYIKAIRKNSTLSLNEIGSLFGGLSESAVSKILSR
jgi:hypothetical protein